MRELKVNVHTPNEQAGFLASKRTNEWVFLIYPSTAQINKQKVTRLAQIKLASA
jgi:hypothetical protein